MTVKIGELYTADCLYRWGSGDGISVVEPDTVVMVTRVSPQVSWPFLNYVSFLYSTDGLRSKEGVLALGTFKHYFTRAGIYRKD